MLKQLIEAVYKSDVDKLCKLTNKGLDPNFQDHDTGGEYLTTQDHDTGGKYLTTCK